MRKNLVKSARYSFALACLFTAFGAISSANAEATDQHRIYPGSNDAANQQARAHKNAPNLFCDKHENECE